MRTEVGPEVMLNRQGNGVRCCWGECYDWGHDGERFLPESLLTSILNASHFERVELKG